MWLLVVLALVGGFGLGWKLRKPEVIQHTKYVHQPVFEPAASIMAPEPAEFVEYDIEPSRVSTSKCGTASRIVLGDPTRTVLE